MPMRNGIHMLVAVVAAVCVGGFVLLGPAVVWAVAAAVAATVAWWVAVESRPRRRHVRAVRR